MNERKVLTKLKREAMKAYKFRGHKMSPWCDITRGSGCYCLVCGKWVQVLLKPLPNEISIGGGAIALYCSALYL
jgi:hypothetical protein